EKAGFTLVVEREIKRRRREDAQSLEIHAGSAGSPHVAREIQFQLVGPDQPAVVPRLAGGEEAVLDPVLAFTQELDRLGLPARRNGQVNKTYRRSLDLGFRAGAKIAQICGEGNALFQEDFWTARSNCGDGWQQPSGSAISVSRRPPTTRASGVISGFDAAKHSPRSS